MASRAAILALAALLALPQAAAAQGASSSSARQRPPSNGNPGATATPLDPLSTPQAAAGPSVGAVNARDPGYATPGAPTTLAPVYADRTGPLCEDFRATPDAGWAATAAVHFPGPQGPIQLLPGQVVAPGQYVQGFDLGSVLERDCPRPVETPPPPTG